MDARQPVVSASEVFGVLTQPSLDPGRIAQFACPTAYAKRLAKAAISLAPRCKPFEELWSAQAAVARLAKWQA